MLSHMKTNDAAAYALFLVPLLLGSAAIWSLMPGATYNPEGDAIGRFYLGWAVTLLLPLLVVMIANSALYKRRIPFPAFLAIVFIALVPVAYFQCASVPPSLLLTYLSNGMNRVEFMHAYPWLVTEALAGFYAEVTVFGYVLYRVIR